MAVRRSKIQVPGAGAGTVPRPRLAASLSASVGRQRLVLLQAPAGFGKTTALAQLAGALPESARAWVQVEVGDDLARVVEALLAALEPVDVPWRESPRALVAEAAQAVDPAHLAEVIVDGLESAEVPAGLVVLDDWHLCQDAGAVPWLERLVTRLPTPWTLALGTRVLPALPLARLRARGEVAEFGRIDLAFTVAEAGEFARSNGWNESSGLAALVRDTQGWAAALRLAFAARRHGRELSWSDAGLTEFLAVEVVGALPPDLRGFLLRCSVLPHLSPTRCAAVSGDARAALHLERLRREDFFVCEVDGQGGLRLHELLRSALREQLGREMPQLLPELLHRAAAGEPDSLQRVAWLLEAGDPAAAAVELEAASTTLVTEGRGEAVARALAGFSANDQAVDPRLALVQARLAWSGWDFEAMRRVLDRVPDAALACLTTELRDTFEAYQVVALDSAHAVEQRDALIERLEARPLAPLPQLLLTVTQLDLPCDEADVRRMRSRLQAVARAADAIGTAAAWHQALPSPYLLMLPGTTPTLQQMVASMQALSTGEPSVLRAWAWLIEAWIELWRGRPATSRDRLALAEDDATWEGARGPVRCEIHRLRSLLLAWRGSADLAMQEAERSIALIPRAGLPDQARAAAPYIAFERRLRVALVAGDAAGLEAALAHLEGVEGGDEQRGSRGGPRWRLVGQGALAALRRDWEQACRCWAAVWPDLARLEGQGLASELRLRRAAAEWRRGDAVLAASLLQPLLAAPAAEIEPGPALLAGPAVMVALASALVDGSLADAGLGGVEQALLARWIEAADAAAALPWDEPESAPLTDREFDVLERIAQGDSNKLIARHFDLSPHTVKRHVANILDKLDLRTRGQAAAWLHARERGDRSP